MVDIPVIKDIDLYPEILEDIDIDLAVKYGVLFSKIEDEIYTILSKENLSSGLNFLSKCR